MLRNTFLQLLSLTLLGACLHAQVVPAGDAGDNEESKKVKLPVIHQRVVITATPLGPSIDRRNGEVVRETLFTRDDQLLQLLDAGINAGQHEGGGKSLEIRRFGFNLDHGGVNGGLRVMVDNVPQNHGTQAHGQGYLGSLKSLSPELIDEVTMINGPFSAEYGDYSGLGVVHVLQRETMPDRFTVRFQGGNYDSVRGFFAWSPNLRERDAIFAYEGSYTNGPFEKPLNYERHNVTGNYTWHVDQATRFGLKWNGGLNNYNSSGQIPLDEVAAGRLSRWGNLSAGDGGRVHSGRMGAYYRHDLSPGSTVKLDGFIERSLFDLYSNFTFYLNNPLIGDAIQQHDSRLTEGANAQYLTSHVFGWGDGLLTAGVNFLGSHNNVDLRSRINRTPLAMMTSAHANVYNGGAYVQESIGLLRGKLQVGGGLRFDVFSYGITDFLEPSYSGVTNSSTPQPKAFASFTPSRRLPLKLFFNYGRGIASIDARSASRRPEGPFINKLDFVQAGFSSHLGHRLLMQADLFRIDASNQVVYIPDDGTIEFTGPSLSYGFEVKASVQLASHLSFNGGLTKVLNSYYKETGPREYVHSAPHFTGNAALTLAGWKSWSGSLRMRAIDHYRLDPLDPSIAATGQTVFDLALARRINHSLEFNLAVDNMFGRDYWETQNYFASRLRGQPPIERIHATPGFSRSIAAGITLHLGGK